MTNLSNRHRSSLAAVALMAASAALSGCAGQSGTIGVEELRSDVSVQRVGLASEPAVGSVVQATRQLGLSTIAAFPGENVIASPASAVIALSMLGTGSSGTTEEQMAQLIGAAGEDRDRAVNALMGTLDRYRTKVEDIDPDQVPANPALHLANQAVVSDKAEIEQGYLDNLATWYDSGVVTTDLAGAEGKRVLDEWVNRNTAGLIKESAVTPDPSLRLVLQNAVLFASAWQVPFDPISTHKDDFYLADGRTVSTDFMADMRNLEYASVDGWQMLELPYGQDARLVARYVLPPEGTGLDDVTAEKLNALESALSEELVDVTVPKLDLSSTLDLGSSLQQQGLTSVFSPEPPALQHISTTEDLYVSLVVQQGRVRVDEEGTVAAATTEIAVEAGAAPMERPEPVEFRADRPHLILLLDKTVGWDLFQIAVNDPTAE